MSTSEPIPSFRWSAGCDLREPYDRVLADMIVKYGGVPLEAPALREIPLLARHPEATRLRRDRLLAADSTLSSSSPAWVRASWPRRIETRHDREVVTAALMRTKVVVRGPSRWSRSAS